ncbi:Uncharacterized protein APZ42_028721 [Daphnia magna]|uniref:Uncharacterized protein n=1 Tax=Daphnia magna TaxID=35525 RepID=A0A164QB91_9CRUS|nr:Uncharacterized protein APZ42_028721 [Daphnia magna]
MIDRWLDLFSDRITLTNLSVQTQRFLVCVLELTIVRWPGKTEQDIGLRSLFQAYGRD